MKSKKVVEEKEVRCRATQDVAGRHGVRMNEVHTQKEWMSRSNISASNFEMYASYGIFKESK